MFHTFAEDFYLAEYPDERDSRGVFGARTMVPNGGPYYHSPPPQVQSSSPYQQSSGVVPDRFRAGRESLSVTRNVTVRDSKRPKARSQDHEYKRRFSSSGLKPSFPDHGNPGDFPMGGVQFQRQSFHGQQGQSPPEHSQSHHPPLDHEPSLRINNDTTLETQTWSTAC